MKLLRNIRAMLAPCRHEEVRGIANYYSRDLRIFLQLIECRDCGAVLIEETRGG